MRSVISFWNWLRYVITYIDIGLYATKVHIIFESANNTKEKA